MKYIPVTQRLAPATGIVWALFAILFAWSPTELHAQENILVILADDLGAESIQSYANDVQTPDIGIRPATPTLERLATTQGRSVRFTNCWANPMCSPTRSSLLTGRHAFRTGVINPGSPFNQAEYSVANALQKAGYSTAAFGKWHLNPKAPGEIGNPIVLGFDRFEGSKVPNFGSTNQTFFSWTKRVETATSLKEKRVNEYAPRENVNNAISWIQKQEDQGLPWFAYAAFNTVHKPFHAPPRDLYSLPFPTNASERYAAMIQAMDTLIGQLVGEVDNSDTTIIFMGDNGNPTAVSEYWGPRAKTTCYEGGVHVPCFVYRGGPQISFNQPTTHDALIHAVDMFDTILDLANLNAEILLPPGTASDSRSFAVYVNDPDLPVLDVHKCNYTQLGPTNGGIFAMRDTRYKLMIGSGGGGQDPTGDPGGTGESAPGGIDGGSGSSGSEELYDLILDPLEMTNLLENPTVKILETADRLRDKRDALINSPD